MAYTSETSKNNYMAVREYPTILAALKDENGVLEPSIDVDSAPLFIKIPRRNDTDAKDSQRRVTVYRRMTYGMRRSADGSWVHYPIYIKVEPKGNLLRGNFLMTEYGREDSVHKEFGPSEDGLRKMFVLGDFIARNQIESYKQNYSNLFGQLIEDMNYQNLFETKFSRSEKEFTEALNKLSTRQINDTEELPFITKLKQLGVITRVPKNFVSNVIRELDKQRTDYNNIVKRSPMYIALQNMMDDFKRVADVNIPNNSSEDLKQQHEWLKQNLHKFDTINTNIDSNDESVKFYHDYLQKQYDFIKNYIKEFYNIDPELENVPYFSNEYIENPVGDDKQNKSPKQIEYERFFSNPQNSRFEKLAKVVFNRIDEFGIEIEYDQDLEVQGKFIRGYNKILVRPDHYSENTLLHECIHALTSYYCDAYEDDRDSLSKEIQTAIEELNYCYKLLKDDAYKTGALTKGSAFEIYELGESDKYGLTNIHEFIAELSNPDFIGRIKDYDNKHNSSVFDKLVDIIARILGIKKEYKDVMTTSYQALKVLLETSDKSLYDQQENKIRTMKENLAKIDTDRTLLIRQNNKYKPIIDAIENAEQFGEMTATLDYNDVEWMWYVPNVENTKIEQGDVIKVVFNDNTGYIVLTKNPELLRDKFTEKEKPFEITFKPLTPQLLSSYVFKIVSNNNSYTQLSQQTLDLFQKIYRNRKNNTEENRKKAEYYVKSRTQGFYKLKNKQIEAYKAIKEINDKLGTTFNVEIDKTTLRVTVPSKSVYSIEKTNTLDNIKYNNIDSIFTLIVNEPSYDSAVQILEQNGYDTNEDAVKYALGRLIKQICKGK